MVGTTFDGPKYANVGPDPVRSSGPTLTKFYRGINVHLSTLSLKFGTYRHIPQPMNLQTLIFVASNVTIVMRNPAKPDQKPCKF